MIKKRIKRINWRPFLWSSIAAFLLLCGVGGYLLRRPLGFLVDLYQVNRVAKAFYQEYDHLTRDIAFHPDMAPRLDVYAPAQGADHPVLLFVYGGGWDDGNKEMYAVAAMKLLPEEMVVVVPDYTLYPDAGYEQMAGEVAAALSWTLENIDQYGGDPSRVTIAGHSAGAHLAGLAVMDPRFLAATGHAAAEVCGFVGVSGIYDVTLQDNFYDEGRGNEPVMRNVMGGLQNFDTASPLSYVRPDLPPVLLIHGAADELAPVTHARKLHTALQAAGAPVTLKLLPGAGHADFLFETLEQERSQLIADVTHFIETCHTAGHSQQ